MRGHTIKGIDVTDTVLAEVVDEVSSQVEAYTGRLPVFSVNSEGEKVEIGVVKYTDYENERHVRGLWFESAIDGKPHSLGAATSQWNIVSPYDAIRPFMDRGYKVRSVVHGEGGASVVAFLSNPEVSFIDPIQWDFYAGVNIPELRGLPLEQSVRIRAGLRKGTGISVDVGFFRLVCTNGLVARVMDLGNVRFDHRTFTEDKIDDFCRKTPLTSPEQLPTAPSLLIPEVIRLLSIDDPVLTPRLIREPLERIQANTSRSVVDDLQNSLAEIHESQERFNHLDLINAVTNAKLVSQSEWSIYSRSDTVMGSLTDLVELAAVRTGEWGFTQN